MPILAQNQNKRSESRGHNGGTGTFDAWLKIPRVDALPSPVAPEGNIVYDRSSQAIYVSTGTAWVLAGGSTVLPAPLESIASLATVADDMLYTTAPDTYATTGISAQGRLLVADTTAAQQRATMGVVIGVDVQGWDSALESLSTLATAADTMIYTTAPDTYSTTALTPYARTLLDDGSATDARATLDVPQKPAASTTSAVARWANGTGQALLNSGVLVSGANDVTGVQGLEVNGNLTMPGGGTLDGITAVERQQVANIDATTISTASWQYVGAMDQSVATTATPAFTGLGAGGQRITAVADPTGATDAANKQYVDLAAGAGLVPIEACQLATAGAVLPNAPAYAHPAETLTATVNGQITVDATLGVNGDRILVKDQADNRENGPYLVTQQGNAGAPYILTRTTDFNQAATPISQNTYILIQGGATLTNSAWTLDATVNTISPLTDAVVWNEFSGPTAAYTGGNGINIAANVVSVDATADFAFPAGQLGLAAPVSVANGGTGTTTLTANNVLVTNGAGNAVVTAQAAPTGAFVGTTDAQVLTNKTLTATTNACRATQIGTTGANVVVGGSAPPPGAGYFLLSTGAAAATWQAFASAQPARTFLVSATGGTHTTIAAALAAAAALVPPPSAANPAVVHVGPGTYNEANPLVVPQNTALAAIDAFSTVVVTPATSTALAVVQCGSGSPVFGITASGASAAGGVGFDIPAGSVDTLVDHCQVIDCETGVRCTGPGTRALLTTCIFGLTAPGFMARCVYVRSGGLLLGTTMRGEGSAGVTISRGVLVEGTGGGSGSAARITDMVSAYCDRAFVVENGAVGQEAMLELASCQTRFAQSDALYVGADAIMTCVSTFAEYTAAGARDLNVSAASGQFYGTANRLRADLFALDPGATVVSQAVNTKQGDQGIDVVGELHVGTHQFPRETCLGGGDSHTVDMHVFGATPALVFTDNTAAASEDDGTTFSLFPGTAVNNAAYIGLSDTAIPNGFMGIKAVGFATAAVYGGATLLWEYWNGAAWTAFTIMARQSGPDYLPRAQVGAFAFLEDQQIRFGMMPSWTTNAVNGVTAWWVRITVTAAPITTVPVLDQIKLHTSRLEVNGDGYVEFFGTARVRSRLPFGLADAQAANLSPGNQDIFVSDNLSCGRIENEFASAANDRIGFITALPDDCDTSMPVRFAWQWYRTSNVTINWIVRWGWTSEGSTIYESTGAAPAVGPNEQSVSKSVPAGGVGQPQTYEQIESLVELDISNMLPTRGGANAFGDPAQGDRLWVSINRPLPPTGGNATLIDLGGEYVRCGNGSYVGV